MGARKSWKFKSKREIESDKGLKDESVHCMDAGGRSWKPTAIPGCDNGGKNDGGLKC